MYICKTEELKRKRLQAGLSRTKLSRLAGLGAYTAARLEDGIVSTTRYISAKAIADVLKCDVSEIFDDRNSRRYIYKRDLRGEINR